jgi:ubiquinone/menaquinone biosynthesis C-methylase UbiE
MTDNSQQKVWDKLAEQWFHFRQKPFYELREILTKAAKEWKPGKILDIGTGNARNLLEFANNGFECYGMDFSGEMLKYASQFAKKNVFDVKLIKAWCEKLPYKDNSFDYALNISVLHHIKKENQLQSLLEMKRVLKPNGKAVITAWNKWQSRFILKKKETSIPWNVKGKAYQRYYYLFNYFELKKLLKKAGFKIIHSEGMFKRLLVFIVQK